MVPWVLYNAKHLITRIALVTWTYIVRKSISSHLKTGNKSSLNAIFPSRFEGSYKIYSCRQCTYIVYIYLVPNIRKCCILIWYFFFIIIVLFLNRTLDDGRLYLATETIPVSNDFPRALYLWHRFSRLIHIFFCQDLSPLK
jgi:hypothetical protein